ncbi:hypothetical protein CPB86DRAFT_816751 [Serendipita vermifera]|nr:hypothetical protein CPB86DRAFT_816751 [Serendipita vermifera]
MNINHHAVSGSQNGRNHSGKARQTNFLAGVMGITNARRALNYTRIFAKPIFQLECSTVSPSGALNEPYAASTRGILTEAMQQFYDEAYLVVQQTSGLGDEKVTVRFLLGSGLLVMVPRRHRSSRDR